MPSPKLLACVLFVASTTPAQFAQRLSFGTGCPNDTTYATYHETMSPYDLGGSPGTETVLLHIFTGFGYVVIGSAPAWHTPTTPDLGMSDDSTSIQTLPFPLFLPGGGTTSTISICSNGYIWLDGSTRADYTPSVSELLNDSPRHCPLWMDLNPAAAGTIHYEADPTGSVVYITWQGVQRYGRVGETVDVQVALFASGDVQYRYQSHTTTAAPLVGYSPGNGAMNPGATDLTNVINGVPILLAPDRVATPMTVTSGRPVEGSSMNVTVTDIPSGSRFGALVISPTKHDPGIQPFPGLADCFQYVGLDSTYPFVPSNGQATMSFNIPVGVFTGATAYAQAFAIVRGFNPRNVASSNGLEWRININ